MPKAPVSAPEAGAPEPSALSLPSWFSPLLQIVTLGGVGTGILATGIWIGGIETTLESQKEALDSQKSSLEMLSNAVLDPQQGISVRAARIEEQIGTLDQKISRLEEWARTITPRIVREDYDRELNRLNARNDSLANQLNQASRNLNQAAADLQRERDLSKPFLDQFRAIDSELAEMSGEVNSLVTSTKETGSRLPEGFGGNLLGRLGMLVQRLNQLRQRLKGPG